MQETSASRVQFLYGGQFTLSTQLLNQIISTIEPRRCTYCYKNIQ